MPQFIDLPGGYIATPPFKHTGAMLHGFLVGSDGDRLQALLDATLNRVPGMRFEAVGNHVLFTALYVDAVTSTSGHWADRGLASESDVGLWLLTRGGRVGQQERLRWWPTYLFVDSGPALAIGREIYGFPKHMARIVRQTEDLNADPRVEVRTLFFRDSHPTARPSDAALLTVRCEPESLGDDGLVTLASIEANLVKWFPQVDDLQLPYLAMPMVMLRQLRDWDDPDRAIVQSLAALEIATIGLPKPGIILSPAELVIQASDSHPIRQQLALAEVNPAVGPVFKVGMDFVAGQPQVI
jgi:hypothetical protein